MKATGVGRGASHQTQGSSHAAQGTPKTGSSSSEVAQKKICAHCKEERENLKLCGRCKLVLYCGSDCQKAAWGVHKSVCKAPGKVEFQMKQHALDGSGSQSTSSTKVWEAGRNKTDEMSKTPAFSFRQADFLLGSQFLSVSTPKDVVIYSKQYSAPHIAQLKRENYQGLTGDSAAKVQAAIDDSNYAEVLKYVWTEEDSSFRLQWLEEKAREGHVLCMFELSRYLSIQCDSANKNDNSAIIDLYTKAIQWYLLGMHCTKLDIACNNDVSTEDSLETLKQTYYISYLLKFNDLLKESDRKQVDIYAKVRNWIPHDSHPSPKWVAYHGMLVMLGAIDIKPKAEWTALRLKKHAEINASGSR